MAFRSRWGAGCKRARQKTNASTWCFLVFAALVWRMTTSFVPAPRLRPERLHSACAAAVGSVAAPSVPESEVTGLPADDLEVDAMAVEASAVESQSPPEEPASDNGVMFAAAAGAAAAVIAAICGPIVAHVGPMEQFLQWLARALQPMADEYAIPLAMGLSPAILHWSHAGNTMTFLVVIGGLGIAEGFAARQNRLTGKASSGPGLHSSFMTVVLVYSALSVVGALASMRYDQQPLFESPHAWSATVAAILLISNAALGLGFRGSSTDAAGARDLHAKIGAAWIAAIVVNAVLGIWLGLSFSPVEPSASEYNPLNNLDFTAEPADE